MARPIKYHHPRTRLHTRILVTLYADLHKEAQARGTTVGELVEQAIAEWLVANDGFSFRPSVPLDVLQERVDTLPSHPHADELAGVFAREGAA